MFVLDTDHIGIIQWQTEPEYSRLLHRISLHSENDFFVAVVSFHEQILGWNAYIANAKKIEGVIKGYARLEQLLTDFSQAQVLPFDDSAAGQFAHLQNQKLRIGTMDLRIASICLSKFMTLLTRNTSDFQRVPALTVEDWTR